MNENEGVHVREARHCLLCGCEGTMLYASLRDRLFGAPGSWGSMRCSKCQMVWLNPQPMPDGVGKFYAQYFTHQKIDAPKEVLAGLRKIMKSNILTSSFGYQIKGSNRVIGSVLSWIIPLREIVGGSVMWIEGGKKGRLLDVGCGNGSFLVQMRQLGWEVVGVEPDREAVSVAREKSRLDIFQGTLEEAKFSYGQFDAITLKHVIEHVLDPIGLLKECRRILKPGGKLVIATPNIKSIGWRIFGEDWVGLDVPRHVYLFSPHALKTCAEMAGLAVKQLQTTAKEAGWMWTSSLIIRRRGMLPNNSPEVSSPFVSLQGLIFQTIEHVLCGRREGGEEVILMATV